MKENTLKWVWLTTLSGMYSAKITSLLDRFDTIEEIYSASEEDYKDIALITGRDIKNLCDKSLDKANKVIERTIAAGGYIMDFDSEIYPERLKRLINPPYVLYVKGNFDFSKESVNVGVVGTRKCTDYGRTVTRKMCFELAGAGCTVISGMARGVDSIAAASALKAGAKTVAVLGSGIDVTYPPENKKLMKDIIANGAVISEYPPLSPAWPSHFPERNRIISALSDCLLVTEAPGTSGALITAKYAHDLGVEIYSVPGDIFMTNSVGTNKLIKAGAKIILHPRDIIEHYSLQLENVEKPQAGKNNLTSGEPGENVAAKIKENIFNKLKTKITGAKGKEYENLDKDEKLIVDLISENGKMSVDELIRAGGLSTARVNSLLSLLEIQNVVKRHAGNLYTLAED